MIVVSPNLQAAGRWILPEEFKNPNHFQLMSTSAQQILEARGLGAAYSPYVWHRRPASAGAKIWPSYAGMTWAQLANRVIVP